MANLIGQSLGQYQIIALLGKGGMSTVYRARQASINRDVAIKVIRPDLAETEDFIKRFEREGQTIASLSHPHILKVFDYGKTESLVYLVMEMMTGGSLNDLIQEGPMPTDMINRMLEQIGSALDYAHLRGVVHRDLKPQNVLLDENQNGLLTDFGIAKLMKETTSLTHSGMALGTPAYMAPEQWRGEAVDARTDIYALGVILFEMLTGQLPFVGDTPYSMMHMHVFQTPPPIRSLKPDVTPGIEQVIDKALAKDRDQRFQTAVDMANSFRIAAAGGSPLPSRPTRPVSPEADFIDRTIPQSEAPVVSPSTTASHSSPPPSFPPSDPLTYQSMPPVQAPNVQRSQISRTWTRAVGAQNRPALIGFGIGALGALILLIMLAVVLLFLSMRNGSGDPVSQTQTAVALLPTHPPVTATQPTFQPSITLYPSVAPTFAPPTNTPNDVLTAAALTKNANVAPSQPPTLVPTLTPIPPSNTALPATSTPRPATSTPVPITSTPIILTTPTSSVPTPAGGSTGKIAFVSQRNGTTEVWLVDVATKQQKQLTTGGAGLPAWSPDGQTITFDSDRSGNKEIWGMKADGSGLRDLTNASNADWLPSWSPDGHQIAFTAERDGKREIYVMNADGSNQRRLTNSPGQNWLPAWSPDGKTIAFTSERDGNMEIYLMNVDGSDQRRITNNTVVDFGSTWSPDSQQLAFVSERDGNREIYTMNVDGTNVRRLTNDPGEDRFPAWSPDGRLIAFDSNRTGVYAIYVMNADGTNLQRLTDEGATDFGAAWQPSGVITGNIQTGAGTPTLVAGNCPGFLPSRLTVGGQGRVSPGLPNRVRRDPTTDGEFLGQIPPGGTFSILDGPRCSPGMAWWEVNYNGLIGWTPEGQNDAYWLEPVSIG